MHYKTTVVNMRIDQTAILSATEDGRYVRIDRRTKWGNPFALGKDGSREEVVQKYREWVVKQPELMSSLHEIKGKTLACWCAPLPCHGDVLAELADKSQG